VTSPRPQPSPVKAAIQAMKAQRNGTADKPSTLQPDGDPVPVQFNPTSLKLERSNNTSTGATTEVQRRQQANEGHATLSLELLFDTAEAYDRDNKPVDVRTLTAGIRKFAEPDRHHPKDAPPPLRFIWGKFKFTGVVSRIGEELDYFASDGTALRAKVSLSLTEQDENFEANKTGSGSRNNTRSTPPNVERPSGPGAPPTSHPDQAAAAQAGESVQQLLTRLGADPSTWRSAMAGLTTPLGLTAGAQVQLDASISAGAGVGVSAGFSAGASAGFAGGLGAGGSIGVAAGGEAIGSAGVSAEVSAGFDFSAQGGIAAAAGQAQARAASAAVAGARAGFDVPGAAGAGVGLTAGAGLAASTSASAMASASASVGAGVVAAAGTSLDVSVSGSAITAVAAVTVEAQVEAGTISRSTAAAAAAAVDPRAISYGQGVPLRPRPAQSRDGGPTTG